MTHQHFANYHLRKPERSEQINRYKLLKAGIGHGRNHSVNGDSSAIHQAERRPISALSPIKEFRKRAGIRHVSLVEIEMAILTQLIRELAAFAAEGTDPVTVRQETLHQGLSKPPPPAAQNDMLRRCRFCFVHTAFLIVSPAD